MDDEHTLTEARQFFQAHAPFQQMDTSHRERLATQCEQVDYADGEVILKPEDGRVEYLFIVCRGRVQGERSGGETFELGEGECFPMGALLGERATRTVYRALGAAGCYRLARRDFAALFTESPVFRDFSIRGVSSLLERVQQDIQGNALQLLGGESSMDNPIAELMHRDVLHCPPETTVREAVRLMHGRKVGSVVVTDGERRPVGIFTLHDLREQIAERGADLDHALDAVMTRDPCTLEADAYAFEAVVEMARHHIRHLVIVDQGRLVGVVSERDLFTLQRVNVVHIMRGIGRAASVDAVVEARGSIRSMIDAMMAHGADSEHLTRVITLLNDRTVRRVIDLEIEASGDPGVPFTWIAFGSEGRGEQTLVTDQDNGILFDPGEEKPDEVRNRLLPLARRINEQLDRCGFTLCKGNIMASNPELCLSAEEWRRMFRSMIKQSTPENLLRSVIYFDFRPVWGDTAAADSVYGSILEMASGHSIFLHMMAANCLSIRPPLGVIRDFVTERVEGSKRDTFDLKVRGLTPFVDAMRVLSLEARSDATSTMERLQRLVEAQVVQPDEAEAWKRSISFIQLLRMRLHQFQARNGEEMTNRLDPSTLNAMDARILKEAFRQARSVQRKLELRFRL